MLHTSERFYEFLHGRWAVTAKQISKRALASLPPVTMTSRLLQLTPTRLWWFVMPASSWAAFWLRRYSLRLNSPLSSCEPFSGSAVLEEIFLSNERRDSWRSKLAKDSLASFTLIYELPSVLVLSRTVAVGDGLPDVALEVAAMEGLERMTQGRSTPAQENLSDPTMG